MLILEILSARRFTTISHLVDQFGVCRKTIQNDIVFLSAYFPIYTVQGKGGGIHVVKGWRNDRLYLTDEQEKVLIRLMQTLPEGDATVLQSIISTFAKPKKE